MQFSAQVTTPEFDAAVERERDLGKDKGVVETMHELRYRPFGNRSLETHAVHGVKRAGDLPVFTSYVDMSRRIIWTHDSDTQVLLMLGGHEVYEQVKGRVIRRQTTGAYAFDLPKGDAGREGSFKRPVAQKFFDFATDSELAAGGLTRMTVRICRSVESVGELVELADSLNEQQLTLVWDFLERNNATHGVPRPDRPVSNGAGRGISAATTPSAPVQPFQIDHLKSIPDLPADQLRVWLQRPIEDWMVFLDPAQQSLVTRPFSGPARIAGPAGTGKTVVGLHRAKAEIERDPDARVMVTTLVSSLPKVLAEIYGRFDPDAGARVEFVGLHAWAYQYLRASGRTIAYVPGQSEGQLNTAIRSSHVAPAVTGMTSAQIKDEITTIIKGRGITRLDDYLSVDRSGRGSSLRRDQRSALWSVASDYAVRLERAGLHDENDILVEALDLLNSDGLASPYSLIVVDEAQDLSLVGARLVAGIARSSNAQLLILGDGRQSIYPGSYRLSDAGIDVRGRSRILSRNYRNGYDVLAAAEAVARVPGGTDPLDETDSDEGGLATRAESGRVSVQELDEQEIEIAVPLEIQRLVEQGAGPGDIAVLVPTNRLVTKWRHRIRDLGIATLDLNDYKGKTTDQVKVGTYHRAKGLEFKHVLMPALDAFNSEDDRRTGEDTADHEHRLGLVRRRVFVAMTRARDSLWIGWTGRPSRLLGRLIEGNQS